MTIEGVRGTRNRQPSPRAPHIPPAAVHLVCRLPPADTRQAPHQPAETTPNLRLDSTALVSGIGLELG